MRCTNSYTLNKNVFSLFLDVVSVMSGARCAAGRLFRTRGPWTAKSLQRVRAPHLHPERYMVQRPFFSLILYSRRHQLMQSEWVTKFKSIMEWSIFSDRHPPTSAGIQWDKRIRVALVLTRRAVCGMSRRSKVKFTSCGRHRTWPLRSSTIL